MLFFRKILPNSAVEFTQLTMFALICIIHEAVAGGDVSGEVSCMRENVSLQVPDGLEAGR